MKGHPKITEVLNKVLTKELTGINQYFIHSKMCKDWGYDRLAEFMWKESIEEMKHAETIIDRILFLDGVPNMQKYKKVMVGSTVQEQFEFDLKAELEAASDYNKAIKDCVEAGDNGSLELFKALLIDEEGHIDWLEAQIHTIEEIGLQNYLTQQL